MQSRKSGHTWKEAYRAIQNLILSLQIKPGEMITEIGMSELLGIGRTPVREAMHKLEQEGLIVTRNRRKYVYVLTVKEIKEIFDIKVCLESQVCAWAAERGTDSQRQTLASILNEMRDLVKIRPSDEKAETLWYNKWLEKDNALHKLIFEMADNQRATNLLNNLNRQWHRLRVGLMTMEDRIEKSLDEHEHFVTAIVKGDSEVARSGMREHLSNLKRVLIQLLRMFDYPAC